MPPKRATSKRDDTPSSAQFFNKQIVLDRIGTVSSKHMQYAGDFFSGLVGDIKNIFEKNLESIDISENFTIVPDDFEAQIVCMMTSNMQCSSNAQHRSPLKAIDNKNHQEDAMDIVVPTSSRSEMVTENDSNPTERSSTPPITSETTEEEMENDIIPRTVTRLRALSVKRPEGTPRNPFSTRLAPQTPIASISTPKKDLRNAKPLVFEQINKTPKAQKPTAQVTRVAQNDKMKHASYLKEQFLQQKIAKAKENDEKMRAVKERKMELERQKQEKLEEKRRKDELAAEFQRNAENQVLKSPSRLAPSKSSSRLQTLQKSPSRYLPTSLTPRSKTTQSSQELTPGRRPAKFGRVETFNEINAHPTVPLSPSRSRARSTHKNRSTEEEQKPVIIQNTDSKSKRKEEKERELRATQEAYLLQKSQEDKLRRDREAEEKERIYEAEKLERKRLQEEAEQKRIMEKERLEKEKQRDLLRQAKREAEAERLAQEKKEEQKQKDALRQARKEAEAQRLAKLQKEEAERLREEEEKERKAYEATIAKQATSSKNAQSSYQMTPPRVYVSNSKDDYGLNDLNSDDETDQEDEPRKDVPAWADWAVVRRSARELASNMPFNINEFFGEIDPINLKTIFGEKVKTKKRGSSAVWKSPMSNSKSTTPKLSGIRE